MYAYDERVAGKGGDALSTLRWLHASSEFAELLKAGTALPDEVIIICDNCVGMVPPQNQGCWILVYRYSFGLDQKSLHSLLEVINSNPRPPPESGSSRSCRGRDT